MHADGGAELIRELEPPGVNVLVLAGDITMPALRRPRERGQATREEVPPHPVRASEPRYYKSSPREVARNLTKLTKAFPEVAILENDTVVIGDQRFIAGTMWFRHQNFHQALNRRGTASRGEDGVSPGGPDR